MHASVSGSGGPWRVAAIVASQTVVLTAVLFYFGWTRANATFRYFGIDLSLLDFSTSDYLLRSANSAFRPLLLIGLVALVATGAHEWLATIVEIHGGRWRAVARYVPVVALGSGVVLVTLALSGLAMADLGRSLGMWLPASLAVGCSLLAYAEFGWRRFRESCADRTPPAVRQLRSFILVGLALMGLFWTISSYAGEIGTQRAQVLASDLLSATKVIIYSRDRLALRGPGMRVDEVRQKNSKYRYRYTGLRLLVRSHDRYVLLPRGWARGGASVYLLRDEDNIRLEFIAGDGG